MTALGKLVLSGANGLKIVLCLFWLECLQTVKFAETCLRARVNKMTDIERWAMLGDREEQKNFTVNEIESSEWDNQFIPKKEMYNTLREISSRYGSCCSVDKQSAVFRCIDALMTMKYTTIGRCEKCRYQGGNAPGEPECALH